MEQVITLHEMIMEAGGGSPVMYFLLGFVAIIGITGQWMLYYKCDLPGVACIVPVWNVTTFLKITGRPAWQSLIVMVPPFFIAWGIIIDGTSLGYGVAAAAFLVWVVYMAKVYYELCICFGRTKNSDILICLALNGFYVLWLGLADSTTYLGTFEEAKKKIAASETAPAGQAQTA